MHDTTCRHSWSFTKFQIPKWSSFWEILDGKKFADTQTNLHPYRKDKNYIPLFILCLLGGIISSSSTEEIDTNTLQVVQLSSLRYLTLQTINKSNITITLFQSYIRFHSCFGGLFAFQLVGGLVSCSLLRSCGCRHLSKTKATGNIVKVWKKNIQGTPERL